jgi:hypothetical protein
MEGDELRSQYVDVLLDRITQSRYPSQRRISRTRRNMPSAWSST